MFGLVKKQAQGGAPWTKVFTVKLGVYDRGAKNAAKLPFCCYMQCKCGLPHGMYLPSNPSRDATQRASLMTRSRCKQKRRQAQPSIPFHCVILLR